MILIGNIFIKMIMKNIKIKMNKNQKGQTLLFVIVAVTIAMAVGVAVSTRTIQSLKRVARTDTSARVIAAAEGGIENLLGRNYSQLRKALYDVNNPPDCTAIGAVAGPENGTCSYVFRGTASEQSGETCTCFCDYCEDPGKCSNSGGAGDGAPEITCMIGEPCSKSISCDENDKTICSKSNGVVRESCVPNIGDRNSNTGDLISSRAVVKVETFSTNEDGSYSFDLAPGEVREIFLGQDYDEDSVLICWDDSGNSDGNAAVYYYSYNQDGDILKGGLRPTDSDFSCPGSLSNLFVVEDADRDPYEFCGRVELVEDAYGLRIKVLFNSSRVSVSTTMPSVPLPTQGYKLTSRGEIVTGSGSEEKATVIVHKSYPYAPDIFDYGIYTPATLSGSN